MWNKSYILKNLQFNFKIFNFLGLSIEFNYAEKVRYILTLLLLIYLSYSFALERIQLSKSFGSSQIFHQVIKWVYMISTSLRGFSCYFQLIYSAKRVRLFIDKVEKIDEILLNEKYFRFSYKKIKLETSFNTVNFLLLNFLITILFRLKGTSFEKLFETIRADLPFLIILTFIQKFVFLLQILNFYVNLLNNFISISAKLQNLLSSQNEKTRKLQNQVIIMSQIYRLLWESSKLLTESFDLILLVQLATSFSSLLTQGYNTVNKLQTHHGILTRNISGIIMTIFNFFMFHFYAQRCLNSVRF